ncbi:hypothetical protein QE152_g2005 [Popillia japonica]|uniref:Uncharacterized protein n=1 Tax=Popillia japonica TaxID=7064 RepID=A0AAW1N6T2_POPJA
MAQQEHKLQSESKEGRTTLDKDIHMYILREARNRPQEIGGAKDKEGRTTLDKDIHMYILREARNRPQEIGGAKDPKKINPKKQLQNWEMVKYPGTTKSLQIHGAEAENDKKQASYEDLEKERIDEENKVTTKQKPRMTVSGKAAGICCRMKPETWTELNNFVHE